VTFICCYIVNNHTSSLFTSSCVELGEYEIVSKLRKIGLVAFDVQLHNFTKKISQLNIVKRVNINKLCG